MYLLKNFITIEALEVRWGCGKELIESFTHENDDEPHLIKYYATEIRNRPDGGKTAIAKIAQYLNGCVFDMDEVLVIEKNHPELVQPKMVKNSADVEEKVIDGKFVFAEHQLIAKEDLYKRWVGATDEEIAAHFDSGELRAYKRYKGPINGVIWCIPGHISYQRIQDFLNPDLYEFHDTDCDYFLLKDAEKCDAGHPEYTGNITPEGLGLAQSDAQEQKNGVPLHAGLATISANEAIKLLGITPIDMADLLNGYEENHPSTNFLTIKRLVTTEEESFRDYGNSGFSEPFFNVQSLSSVKIYKIDLDRYCESWQIPPLFEQETTDPHSFDPNIAERQNKIEELTQLNTRLEEQNQQLISEITKKDLRIAELETQTIPAIESTTTVNATKWKESVEAALRVWVGIFAGDKKDWIEDDFRGELSRLCKDYHTDVHAVAWRLLPEAYKHGRGRPKKNPK